MASAEIKRHWGLVAELGCVVSRNPIVTLHHTHGGSMNRLPMTRRGVAQKTSDWLVIPLAAPYHTGPFGIDNGLGRYKSVDEWEAELGAQVDFLIWVSWQLCYSVFERAGVPFKLPMEPQGLLQV